MTTIQHLHLGPDAHPISQGRLTHGRWRIAFQPARPAPEPAPDQTPPEPWPAALHVVHDPERLTFALTEGLAAELLAQQIADFLWQRDTITADWPVNLREWLADHETWESAPPGPTAFICGRLERDIAGGRIYLAWLGMNGVILLDRHGDPIELDTVLADDEQWTPAHGPEPVGMGLHAYRGGLFGLDRLLTFTSGAAPFGSELPDLATKELAQALEDWAEGAPSHLAFFDLRLNPVLTEPKNITVNYRWVSADTCLIFWQPAPNTTGYRIEASPSPTFETSTLIAELTDSRQGQYHLSPPVGSPTYYRVIPLNQSVLGTPGTPFSLTPITLAAPILEPVEWSPNGGYSLRWTALPQATSYEVQVSMSADFDPHDSMVIFRGENPELHLPGDSQPNQYYRVRAINALYAPQMPSTWSEAQRSPSRLSKPIFTQISPKRIEWEPVPGARQYEIEVSDPTEPDTEPEVIATQQPLCLPAEQTAMYRVRALRHPEDQRTASEWSDQVNLAPQTGRPSPLDARFAIPVLLIGTIVALMLGIALGLLGLSAYQDAHATASASPFPEDALRATKQAATAAIGYATEVRIQSTRAAQGLASSRELAATGTSAARDNQALDATNVALGEVMQVTLYAELTRTHIPSATPTFTVTPSPTMTPSATLTPSATPNLTETLDAAFGIAQAATAAQWTATFTPSATVTPSRTPNLTATLNAAFKAAQTATAAQWTATPPATLTPTVPAAPSPTATFTPSRTPNMDATFDAMFAERLTATAQAQATALIASLSPGCFVIAPLETPAVVYLDTRLDATTTERPSMQWRQVFGQRQTAEGLWLHVQMNPTGTYKGWLLLAEGVTLADVVGGSACNLAVDVPVVD